MEVFIQDSVAAQCPAGDVFAGEGRARKERADCKVTDEGLYHAIVAHLGVLSYVALAVGINRSALYKRIDRAPALQAARDGARRILVSVATYHLRKAIHAGVDWAVHYFMCREYQLWTPFNEPQPPTEAQANRAPREPKLEEAEEVEPQLERAGKSLQRLIRAVERGEPWAVKYCLNHLDPRGRYAKKSRGRKTRATAETVSPEVVPVVIDEVAAELAKAVFDENRRLMAEKCQKNAAPPVLDSDNRPAAEPATTVQATPENAAPTKVLMSEAVCQEAAMILSARSQQLEISAPTLETDSAPTVSGNGQDLSHKLAPTVDDPFAEHSGQPLSAATLPTTVALPDQFTPTLNPAPTLFAAPPNAAPTKPAKSSPAPKRKQQKAQSRDRTRKRRVRPLSKKRSHVRKSESPIG